MLRRRTRGQEIAGSASSWKYTPTRKCHSLTKQYNLVLVKLWRCSAAGNYIGHAQWFIDLLAKGINSFFLNFVKQTKIQSMKSEQKLYLRVPNIASIVLKTVAFCLHFTIL